ncbi:hypothetical protein [Kribbella speibonae]|uniref:hypothetical protein n=1 Tax=Kribbella speibonae TaxID=1572660 RepID=UPI0013F3BC44|nr:hypothetical protein [Kribbella speibonae]
MSYQQWSTSPNPGPAPRFPSRPAPDPIAVALGNASLLGIGYFLARRWFFGGAGVLGTAVLVACLTTLRQTGYEFGLLGWGLLQVVHGWLLARRQPQRAVRVRQRLGALGVALLVLIGLAFERYDVQRIDEQAIAAREAGDCPGVRAAQATYTLGHRIGNGPRTVRVEGDVATCDRIDRAADQLRTAAPFADLGLLQAGFENLAGVLAQPGQTRTVGKAVSQFPGMLPVKEPCTMMPIMSWLRTRKPTGTVLDDPNALVPKLEPNALFGCADANAANAAWPQAQNLYRTLAARYPRSEQAIRARAGIQKAEDAIQQAALEAEVARVRALVKSGKYCATPAKLSMAPRVRHGQNRAVFLGAAGEYTSDLPSQWRTSDPYRAALIVCASTPGTGAVVKTCSYTDADHPEWLPFYVAFRKITVPVNVYEMRTGRLLSTTTIQISGTACPKTWYSQLLQVSGSTTSDTVEPTTATIRAAFQPLVVRP